VNFPTECRAISACFSSGDSRRDRLSLFVRAVVPAHCRMANWRQERMRRRRIA
jgi:hypothetical protein